MPPLTITNLVQGTGSFPTSAPPATVGMTRNTDSPTESESSSASAHEPNAAALDAQRIFFPLRLHDIISDPSTDDIIKWLPSGKAFIIADKKRFAAEILPQCFLQHCQFTSFTRKLTRWRFSRVPRGPLIGAYYHELFTKGCRDMCYHMTCKNEVTRTSCRTEAVRRPRGASSSLSGASSARKQVTHTRDNQQCHVSSSVSSGSSTPPLYSSKGSIQTSPAQPLKLPKLSQLPSLPTEASSAQHHSSTTSLENGLNRLVEVEATIRMLQQAHQTQLILQQAREQQLAEERAEALRLALLSRRASLTHATTHLDPSFVQSSMSPEAVRVLNAINMIQTKQDLLSTLSSLAGTR